MSDRKYWRKRSVKLGLLSERKAQRTARAVLDAYDKVLTTVQGRIERIFARFVRNNDSLNAEKARQLLSVRETQKYRQELLVLYHSTTDKALRDELRAMLEAPAYANRISRLEALRDIVRADCRQLGLLERELVGKGLADALQEAYTRQVFDIQQGTGYGRRIKTLEDKQVRAILGQKWRGGNFSGRIWNNNQAFADAVQQTILTGTLAGMSFREMSDMLLQITGTDATSGAKANSMRLIRTEFCHISAQGALLGYKSYDLEYYRYLATLDSQTDEECGALDMRRFPVNDATPGVNFPPMHPNCRCTTMPDMSEQVIAKIKRAARDPATGKSITVPGNMSYAEWHKKFVQGVPEAEAAEKGWKNRAADRKQLEQYRDLLGDYAPKSLVSFQRLKYNEPEKWQELKALFREVKWQKDAQANGIIQGSEHKVPYEGTANTVFDNYKDGKLNSRRYYGQTGKPRLDIDMTDHGNPKKHPIVPHRHSWAKLVDGNVKRSTKHDEELTTAEKIANADILNGGEKSG